MEAAVLGGVRASGLLESGLFMLLNEVITLSMILALTLLMCSTYMMAMFFLGASCFVLAKSDQLQTSSSLLHDFSLIENLLLQDIQWLIDGWDFVFTAGHRSRPILHHTYCPKLEIDQLLQFCMHNFILLIFA